MNFTMFLFIYLFSILHYYVFYLCYHLPNSNVGFKAVVVLLNICIESTLTA